MQGAESHKELIIVSILYKDCGLVLHQHHVAVLGLQLERHVQSSKDRVHLS